MVETSRKEAVKIFNVIQIMLTFLLACLLAFLKRAGIKKLKQAFSYRQKTERNAFEMLTVFVMHVKLITTPILIAQ